MAKAKDLFNRRTRRNRYNLRARANGRPRLCIFRSSKHIYAQVIDDLGGRTLAAASTVEAEMRGKLKNSADVDAASVIGKLVAERAGKAGVSEVVFDRGGYNYHGRVKALAEAAREAGLRF